MNNNLFIDRCETLFTTVRSGNFLSVTTKQIANWLEMELAPTSQFVAKVISLGMLEKVGRGRNTSYKLTSNFSNSLESSISTHGNDVITGVKQTVKWYVERKPITSKEVVVNGKKLIKVDSKPVTPETQQAIDYMVNIIKTVENLKAENELLKEEIERLRKYEEYYKQIKEVKL